MGIDQLLFERQPQQRIRHRKKKPREKGMPPCERPPRSTRKRKGEPCCLATSTRGHARINQKPSAPHSSTGRAASRVKSPLKEKRVKPESKIKQNSTRERIQDAGHTRTSTLRSMPELPKRPALLLFWLARAHSNIIHLIAPSPPHHASCRCRRPNCPSTAAQGH